ncbi:MAG: hypothetical protein AB7V14_01370 [Kiritimatiellia bacterium]
MTGPHSATERSGWEAEEKRNSRFQQRNTRKPTTDPNIPRDRDPGRSDSRLTPRRQDAKKLLKGRKLLGGFVPLCENFFENGPIFRKMPVFGPKIANFHRNLSRGGAKRPKTAFSGDFYLQRALRRVSVDHFLTEAYARNDKAQFLCRA